jgi:spermidine synthase
VSIRGSTESGAVGNSLLVDLAVPPSPCRLDIDMNPPIILDATATPDGGYLEFHEQEGVFGISLDGQELMQSNSVASEILLGSVGVAHLNPETANHVLIGGLGLGFTLRSVLDAAGPETSVAVVELIPAVVEWNRSHLTQLNRAPLDDPRVTVQVRDVCREICEAKPQSYDAILLDVDNGPFAMVAADNASLYSDTGIQLICRALKPGGRAVFWSARRDPRFEERLNQAELKFEAIPAKAHEGAERAAYLLYVLELS